MSYVRVCVCVCWCVCGYVYWCVCVCVCKHVNSVASLICFAYSAYFPLPFLS